MGGEERWREGGEVRREGGQEVRRGRVGGGGAIRGNEHQSVLH